MTVAISNASNSLKQRCKEGQTKLSRSLKWHKCSNSLVNRASINFKMNNRSSRSIKHSYLCFQIINIVQVIFINARSIYCYASLSHSNENFTLTLPPGLHEMPRYYTIKPKCERLIKQFVETCFDKNEQTKNKDFSQNNFFLR